MSCNACLRDEGCSLCCGGPYEAISAGCCLAASKEACRRPPCPCNLDCWSPAELRALRRDAEERRIQGYKSAPRDASRRGHGTEPIGGSMQNERTEVLGEGVLRRKARKQHRCAGCRRTIAVGESHIEDLNMARGAYASGPRYCDGCALDAGLLIRVDESGS